MLFSCANFDGWAEGHEQVVADEDTGGSCCKGTVFVASERAYHLEGRLPPGAGPCNKRSGSRCAIGYG